MANTKEFKITRVFNASRELVWRAWTDPEMAMKWWGPEGFTSPSIKIDLRVGGKYIFAMQGPKGTEWDKVMYSAGVYKEIIPFEKIVCTDYFSNENGDVIPPSEYGAGADFPVENLVTVTFEEYDGKTTLSIVYGDLSEEVLEVMLKMQMKEGWESSLEKLEKILVI
jgi:uncharacterized protein YndB with AHSA1/START domain